MYLLILGSMVFMWSCLRCAQTFHQMLCSGWNVSQCQALLDFGRVDTFVLAKTRRFAKYVLLLLVEMIIKGQAMQKRWCPVCFHCAVTLELFGTNAQWLQPRNEQSHDWGKGGLRPTISTQNVVLRPSSFRLHNVDFPTICVCLNLPAYPYQLHEADIMVWTMKLYLGVSASLAALFPPLS